MWASQKDITTTTGKICVLRKLAFDINSNLPASDFTTTGIVRGPLQVTSTMKGLRFLNDGLFGGSGGTCAVADCVGGSGI